MVAAEVRFGTVARERLLYGTTRSETGM